MDVRCEKCDTVYELEDARVTDSGVDVKCTQCGHIFRARRRSPLITKEMAGLRPPSGVRPGQSPVGPTGSGAHAHKERVFHLRLRHSQEVVRFRDLLALRQWIIDKRVTRDDDISRSGVAWRRLGSVVELESFFFEGEQASAARLRTGRRPVPQVPVWSSGQSLPHEPRRLRTDTPGQGVGPLHPSAASAEPLRSNISTMLGPSGPLSDPRRGAEDGAPIAPMRLSGTGRTMRPKLHAPPFVMSPPEGSAPVNSGQRTQTRVPLAVEAAAAAESATLPMGAPTPISDRPSGAVPRPIAVSSPLLETKHRHVLPLPSFPVGAGAGAGGGLGAGGGAALASGATPGPGAAQGSDAAPRPGAALASGGASSTSTPSALVAALASSSTPAALADSLLPSSSTPSSPTGAPVSLAALTHLDEVLRRSDPVPRTLQSGDGKDRVVSLAAEEDFPDWPLPAEGSGDYGGAVPVRRRWVRWAAAAVAVLGVAGGVGYMMRAPSFLPGRGQASSRSESALTEGMRALAGDTDEDFQRAHEHFARALTGDESNVRAQAALAELHACWAHALRQDLRQASPDQAALVQREIDRHNEQARHYANQLVNRQATPAVNRALALVRIESGVGRDQIEPLLQTAGETPAEREYPRALLLLRETRLAEARTLLSPLREGASLRLLMLMGELAREAGAVAEARQLFTDVLARNPRHRRAEQALSALALAQRAAPDGGAEADAATGGAAAGGATAGAATAGAATAGAATAGGAAAGGTTAGAAAKGAATGAAAPAARPGAERPAPEAIPRDYPDRVTYAQELLERGRSRDAQRLFQQLAAEHPEDPEVHVGLGACAIDAERYQAAVDHYKQALARRSDYPAALIGLGETYKLRGDNAAAMRYYRTYLDRYPTGPQAALARNNIARLSTAETPGAPPEAPSAPPARAPAPSPAPESPPPAATPAAPEAPAPPATGPAAPSPTAAIPSGQGAPAPAPAAPTPPAAPPSP